MAPSQIETQATGFATESNTLHQAKDLDREDPLRPFRGKFLIPSKQDLKKTALNGTFVEQKLPYDSGEPSIYLCGNSLGLQPRAAKEYLSAYLETWVSIGVNGHFTNLGNSPLIEWQSMAEDGSRKLAKIVGALPQEVIVMNTLTTNLHLMMSSFYRPTAKRNKILLEWKPFPSDHYAIESQITWHGYDPKQSMIMLTPDKQNAIITTEKIISMIDAHAEELALVLLPGVQYYSGQFFAMAKITQHAKSLGITVGWDLAHAVGNVELQLHDWNVDFAVWCNYKYMNSGPGAIGGAFVHERHGEVEWNEMTGSWSFLPRLMGWYGGDKSTRFNMDNKFKPAPGAAGFQLSTTSVVDLTCLLSSLSIFEQTSMSAIRQKSVRLTGYLEQLLDDMTGEERSAGKDPSFSIITPRDPAQRGAQLSVLFKPGLLDIVFEKLKAGGVVADKRKPDVMRIAPVPLYNTFEDVWGFVRILKESLA